MLKTVIIRVILSFTFLILVADFSSAALPKDYKTFLAGQPQYSPEEIAHFNDFHFVFVGGFMNELISGYFSDNVRAMWKAGIKHVDRVFPSSANGVDLNAEILIEKTIPELYINGGGRPLILLAHSKAGAETLAALLMKPELMLHGQVDRLVTIQSPLRGSHMGDQAGVLLGRLTPILEGLHSMTSEEIDKAIRQRINTLDPMVKAELSKRVYYVISSQDVSKLPSVLVPLGKMMSQEFGRRNDGVIATQHMWLPGFGRVIGKLDANHIQLVFREGLPFITPDVPTQTAFTHAALNNIWTPAEEDLAMVTNAKNIRSLGEPPLLTRLQICAAMVKKAR